MNKSREAKVPGRIWILNEEVAQYREEPIDPENHKEYVLAGSEQRAVVRRLRAWAGTTPKMLPKYFYEELKRIGGGE